MTPRATARLAALVLPLIFLPASARAFPEKPRAVSGTALFEKSEKERVLHVRANEGAVIEFASFVVEEGETVHFHLPGPNSFCLVRSLLDGGEIQIKGQLLSNGNLILNGVKGVFLEQSARVEVEGLVLTTLDMQNVEFRTGRSLYGPSDQAFRSVYSSVTNYGQIEAAERGYVVLMGSTVLNEGVISIPGGFVAFVTGDEIRANLARAGFSSGGASRFEVTAFVSGKAVEVARAKPLSKGPNGEEIPSDDFADGEPKKEEPSAPPEAVKDQIKHAGTIEVAGGGVFMRAEAKDFLFENAVHISGHIRSDAGGTTKGPVKISGTGAMLLSGSILTDGGDIEFENYHHNIVMDGTYTTPGGRVRVRAGNDLEFKAKTFFKGRTYLEALENVLVNGDVGVEGSDLEIKADASLRGNGALIQSETSSIDHAGRDALIQTSGPGRIGSARFDGNLRIASGGIPAVLVHQPDSRVAVGGAFLLDENVALSAGNAFYSVGGDWTNRGVFDPQGSIVKLTGRNEIFVQGSTTFQNFVITEGGKIVHFEPAARQTVLGNLTLEGQFARPLVLRSSVEGKPWEIEAKGDQDNLAFIDVQDSKNVDTTHLPLAPLHARNSLGNFGWDFKSAGPMWTGESNNPSWSNPLNWDGGFVPAPGDIVRFGESSSAKPSVVNSLFEGKAGGLKLDYAYKGALSLGRDLDVDGDVVISGGKLKGESHTFAVSGNWMATKGEFVPGKSTVVIQDASFINGLFFCSSGEKIDVPSRLEPDHTRRAHSRGDGRGPHRAFFIPTGREDMEHRPPRPDEDPARFHHGFAHAVRNPSGG